MIEPATGTGAASTAITITGGTLLTLGSTMPGGASFYEFMWGCFFAMLGACSFQFIRAQDARQKAADKGVPVEQRPRIDIVMVGYAMLGAIISAACMIYAVHQFGGATGFGDATWLQSVAGYMVAGAAGPPLVLKMVGYFTNLMGSKAGGNDAGGSKP